MTLLEEMAGAIADAKNTEPEDLEIALEHYVDTDSSRALAEHKSNSWSLRFGLPNHTIEVTGQGAILVDGQQKRTLA
jgi:hypothetical protein